MARSSRNPTSRRQISKTKRLVVRVLLVVGIGALVVWVGLISLSYAKWGRVDTVVIAENPHIDQDQAHADVSALIDAHWPIMGNHNRHWSLPRKKIRQQMVQQANTIRSVDLDYRENTLFIEMEVFEPYYITCFLENDCGFTSRDGYVYDQAPDFSPGVYSVLVVNHESPVYTNGPLYLSEQERNVVDSILLAEVGGLWDIPNKVVMDVFDVQIFFNKLNNTSLPDSAYVVINQKHLEDYEEYLSRRLQALLTKTDFFERLKIQGDKFEYLDLRFEDKIYMKFSE